MKTPGSLLPLSFFTRSDVTLIAQELLGKWLLSEEKGSLITGGMIVETEAYAGPDDRASHAFGNLRTKRTEVLFHRGGIAYVYLCYGIHSLLNVVTNIEGIPHAVLIRAIAPLEGLKTMQERRGKTKDHKLLCTGPGALCQALGITREHNGLSFQGPRLWLEDRGVTPQKILTGPRIGIDYAGQDALLPWRFRAL